MSWPMVRIGELCSLMTGGTPKTTEPQYYDNGDVPWIVSGDIHKGEIYECEKRITQLAVENSNARYLPKDSVLIALNGQGKTRGTVALLRIDGATCNQSIVSINPNNPEQLSSEYLFYYLKSQYQQIRNITGDKDRAGLNMPLIRAIEIPLPPLAEQKRIAAILDKADAIRRKRQQAIQLADDFLRAVFLEMFGDPVTNPKGFPVGTIRELVETANYGSSAKASEEIADYPMLRMGNITYEGALDMTDLKYINLSESDKPKYLVSKSDLLFNRTNSKELVGKTAVYDLDEPAAFAGYLIRVRTNAAGNTYYLSAYLNSTHGKATLQNMCKSIVGMANINAQEMQNIPIMLPPVGLQDKFRDIVVSAKEKVKVHEFALRELVTLFDSLSQKAFAGKL
ncbi:restriction endonuclease subunit S [Rheinheimera gaetbuli]